jgi:hypothetical protein
MNPFFIKRAEYVEVAIPANNTNQRIYFPDLPNLRESKIFGIEVYDDSTQGITFTGATTQNIDQLKNSIVNLYFDGGYYIQVPTLSLFRFNSTTFFASNPMLAGQTIVWAKSYMFLTDSANIGDYESKTYLFNVYYTK